MVFKISASELFQLAKEMLNDGMSEVEITYLEEDDLDGDDPLPPSLHFSARKKDDFLYVDYEDIEAVESDE